MIKVLGIFVPGFSGISAPYWEPGFDDVYVDLGSDPNQTKRSVFGAKAAASPTMSLPHLKNTGSETFKS